MTAGVSPLSRRTGPVGEMDPHRSAPESLGQWKYPNAQHPKAWNCIPANTSKQRCLPTACAPNSFFAGKVVQTKPLGLYFASQRGSFSGSIYFRACDFLLAKVELPDLTGAALLGWVVESSASPGSLCEPLTFCNLRRPDHESCSLCRLQLLKPIRSLAQKRWN